MTGFIETLRYMTAAQKPAKGVSVYTLFVNRPAGRVLAALAYRAGATPNQLTVLGALFTFPALAAVALVRPGPGLAVCVCAALAVGFALDAADGQLARTQRSGSPSGEWLDHVLDCVKLVTVHLVVLVSFYRFFSLPSPAFLLAPMLFELAAVVIFFAGILTEQLKRRTTAPATPAAPAAPAESAPALRSVLLLPVDYGVTCLGFLFLGSQHVFLSVYCTLLLAHLVFMAAFLVKWFRELR
ncbi:MULTISPECIES: CDP-alcohol phosphatidyltransferase family protein [Streptomyces]|uniref:CDP-alcohol phosphatidyltransferase family protein n=1 Tax=Streptomyces TaxID=1883 RepID=UPI00073DE868|nr:CDP-alcohol phosphatidyltransferase family protein [Streptomyces sp. FBKL.4005]MYU27675.1 CDP-alcohol phosphatidyltransferase [Streptomyces sp. SID7810]OYP19317.1 CDP-alcohol phosphatidyltransferase [Streptomyces sp. FBKL.4005]CUW26537.1 CDP-alcohol phosphatidyltransferase [Streptomyces reticuli]